MRRVRAAAADDTPANHHHVSYARADLSQEETSRPRSGVS
jgi:hypothetical protein